MGNKTSRTLRTWRVTLLACNPFVGETAKVLPPKAFSGSSIKSNVKALEAFASERIAGK